MRINRFVADGGADQASIPHNICGVLVMARPQERHRVATALAALPGVEIHLVGDQGKLITTVEDTTQSTAGPMLERIGGIPGVLSVTLVYHHFDSDREGEIVP